MNYYIAITKECNSNVSYIYIYSHEFHCMLATRLILCRCISKKLSKRVINNLISRYLIIHNVSNNSKIYFGSLERFEQWVEIPLTDERIVQVYEV